MSEVEFLSIFADNLRDLMVEVGVGQNELAKEIGIDKAAVSRYLNKQIIPSLPTFINICVALDCRPDDLIPLYDFIY